MTQDQVNFILALHEDETLTTREANRKICAKLNEVFKGDFPCICGDNPLSDRFNADDKEKLAEVLICLDLLK